MKLPPQDWGRHLDQSVPQPHTILLVEDNAADVRLLEEVFAAQGGNVSLCVARDGAEAIAILEDGSRAGAYPDLVLLDLNLPKVSGHEVLIRLKKDPRTRPIPVLILTSSRADSDVTLAYEFQANAYLRKPSTLEGLFAVVRHIKSFWLDIATLPRPNGSWSTADPEALVPRSTRAGSP